MMQFLLRYDLIDKAEQLRFGFTIFCDYQYLHISLLPFLRKIYYFFRYIYEKWHKYIVFRHESRGLYLKDIEERIRLRADIGTRNAQLNFRQQEENHTNDSFRINKLQNELICTIKCSKITLKKIANYPIIILKIKYTK